MTHVIVAGLQVMACNERSRKGCSQKSEPEGSSCFLGLKGAERAERGKPAGCAKTGAKSGAKLCAKNCFSGRGILREIWREIGAKNLGL